VLFFKLSTAMLVIVLLIIEAGATAIGIAVGHRSRRQPSANREPVGVVQATLLGLVGLLLAFGLSMAVGRYETRRELIVDEANDIGTTYLRAQTLNEPYRTESLESLRTYTEAAEKLSTLVPDSQRFRTVASEMESVQRTLWNLAGQAIQAAPLDSAPRLYVETLNSMIDVHSERTASLRNRVPTPVTVLLVVGSAVALAALAMYLTMLGRGLLTSLVATAVVVLILFVSFDLDRPERGFIVIPNTPLVEQSESMQAPPAFIPAGSSADEVGS
jgi:hypothetical protein